jgi:diguanylate cyclase (GGDEF)-like protein/PAS domain S-box-containing protein
VRHIPAQTIYAGALAVVDRETAEGRDQTVSATMREILSSASRADLEAVLGRAPIGILHSGFDQQVLLVNDAYCTIVGRSAAELAGRPFEHFTHPDDVERSSSIFLEQLAKIEPYEIEKRYVRPDGTAIWCAVHVSFVLDDEGLPQSIITVASDITARHRAQEELRESEEHYRHTVELVHQVVWTANPSGSIVEVSSRWFEITGIAQEGALGERWLKVLHPDDVAPTRAAWRLSVASGKPVDIMYRLLGRDETYRWYRSRAKARTNAAGAVIRWYGTLEDIHERRQAEQALRDSEERFRLAAQAAGLGIWDFDALHSRREWSNEFKLMLGLTPDAVPRVETALALVVPEDRHLLQALVDAAQAGDSSARFEVILRVRRADDGGERWMRTDGWRIYAPSGRLERVLVTIRDVTEERTAEERIRWTASHDALTGIPNRAHFADQLERALAHNPPEREMALVLLDLDHLKEVNDTIGHDAGDVLLRTFAGRLQHAFGAGAMIGRLGGDEFAVLLEGVGSEQVHAHVEQALEQLRHPFEHEGYTCDTQATAGASLYPANGTTADELLKSADIALYVGKNQRRGEMSLFAPAMRAEVQRRASMLNVARLAVRDDLILPFYQPKVCLKTRRVVGFEALLRWRDKGLGVQGPETITSAFDDLGLAIAMSDRMLECIAGDMRAWLDRGIDPVRVAINLSPAEFRHDGLAERIMKPFARQNVPFDRIELEITETVLLGRDTERLEDTLATFHHHGFRIALDDFGTGYASLTHLKTFPVDVIKVDRSFVSNLRAGSDDAAIVDAVISLAHRLNMEVVAEGVEQDEQADYLTARGCDYAQGYLFGRAVSADEVARMIRR